jgi:hypothetical protein
MPAWLTSSPSSAPAATGPRTSSGGLFSGEEARFTCGRCRHVVSALVWISGARAGPPGNVAAIWPRCRSRELAPFRDDEVPAGRCPRWNRHVMAHVVGIAD